MTGWRLGVATGPATLIEKMRVLLETIMSCVPTPIQWAGVAALTGDQSGALSMAREFGERRDLMCALMDKTNLSAIVPAGGLYVWARVPNGMTDHEYSEWAFSRGVVVSPGSVFGCGGYVRFTFARCKADIIEGMRRLAQ
jgi:aspartate/methionine/tyrosine aminotransferase